MTEREDVFSVLEEYDVTIIKAYAACGMRVAPTAKESHFDRRTVSSRLTTIRLKTGIDPRDFWGLQKLVEIIKEREGASG